MSDENRDPPGPEVTDRCGREDLRIGLGALALDALDPAEARDVRRHLADCSECQAEYTSFLGVRSLMDAGMVGGPARSAHRPPVTAAARSRPARFRPQRRLVLATGGALASVVLVAAGFFALGRHTGSSAPPTAVAGTRVVSNHDARVTATISYRNAAWGTSISTKLSGVPAAYHCSLVVVAKDGDMEFAGSWSSTAGGAFTVPGAVGMPADEIDHFELDLAAGYVLQVPASTNS